MVATTNAALWNVQQLSASMAAALVPCTRGEVAIPMRRVVSEDPGNGLLACSYTMVQTLICVRASIVNGTTHIAQAHEERERALSCGDAVGVDLL